MEFKRWHTLAAVVCSLSSQVIALAQQPEAQTLTQTLVIEGVDLKPSDQPAGGAPTVKIQGARITIRLPNGETKQIELPGHQPGQAHAFAARLASDGQVNGFPLPKYVIGVSLSEVPGSVRAHVALPEGVGVMVGSVVPDSPAAQAGFQQYDLLLQAGERVLKSPKDLQEVVDASDGKPVSIAFQRKGEQKIIEVTPQKREEIKFTPLGEFNLPVAGNFAFLTQELELLSNMPVFVRPAANLNLPAPPVGVTLGNPQQLDSLTQAIRSLAEQVERLQSAVNRLEKQQHTEDKDQETKNNRAKDDKECSQLPLRDRLTTLIRLS